jgi:hypothetical protein
MLPAPTRKGLCPRRAHRGWRGPGPNLVAEARMDLHPLIIIVVILLLLLSAGRGLERNPIPCLRSALLLQRIAGHHPLAGLLLRLVLLPLLLLGRQPTHLPGYRVL